MNTLNQFSIEILALQCARAALRKVCPAHLRYMWLDDAIQVAALKLVEINDDMNLGYKKVSARRAVQEWWFEFVIGDRGHRNDGKNRNIEFTKKSFDELSGWLQAQEKPATNHPQRIWDHYYPLLVEAFTNTRIRRGGNRAREAASRDARISLLVFMGYSYEGIAQEMRISQNDVSNYIKVAANRARLFIQEAGEWNKPEEYDQIFDDGNQDYELDYMKDVNNEILLGESTLAKMRAFAQKEKL